MDVEIVNLNLKGSFMQNINEELLKLFKAYDKEAGTNLTESWINESSEIKEIYLNNANEMTNKICEVLFDE